MTERTMDDRLRAAYATAMQQQHASGSVEIHLGSHVLEYLRSIGLKYDALAPRSNVWGFPVIPAPGHLPNHISVHTVQQIL